MGKSYFANRKNAKNTQLNNSTVYCSGIKTPCAISLRKFQPSLAINKYLKYNKSLKSNLVIMLYNLVEATVRVSMNNYYDNFNNKENNYFLSAEKIKKIWIKYSSQSFKENFIQQQVFEMIETAINNEIAISLDFSKIGEYSFNMDCLSMRLIYGRNATGKTNFGRALLDIKILLYGMFRNDENSVLINADSQKDTAKFIYEFLFGSDEVIYKYSRFANTELCDEEL